MSIKIPARLKQRWQKKLRASGFQDIEDEDGRLKRMTVESELRSLTGFQPGIMESIRDYFSWAEEMANRKGRVFKSAADRQIWTLHSRGLSSREIAESVPFDQTYIARKIKKIREYLKQQTRFDREDSDAA